MLLLLLLMLLLMVEIKLLWYWVLRVLRSKLGEGCIWLLGVLSVMLKCVVLLMLRVLWVLLVLPLLVMLYSVFTASLRPASSQRPIAIQLGATQANLLHQLFVRLHVANVQL